MLDGMEGPASSPEYQAIKAKMAERQAPHIAKKAEGEASQSVAELAQQPQNIDIAAASTKMADLLSTAIAERDAKDVLSSIATGGSNETPTPDPEVMTASVEAIQPLKPALTESQAKIAENLGNNLDLFASFKSSGTMAESVDGKMVPTDAGRITAENLRALISREAKGNVEDVKKAVAKLKSDIRFQIREVQKPHRRDARMMAKAFGVGNDRAKINEAIRATSQADTAPLQAKLAILDSVLRAERSEATRVRKEARNVDVATIRATITDEELSVYRAKREASGGKKVPDGLLRNMLAQQMQALTADRPTRVAIQSHKIDDLMSSAIQDRNVAEKTQSDAIEAEKVAAELARQPQNIDIATASQGINDLMRASGSIQEARPLTVDEQAAVEIRRMDAGNPMSGDLPQEVRDRIYQVRLLGEDELRVPKARETHQDFPERNAPIVVLEQLDTARMSWRERVKAKLNSLRPAGFDYKRRPIQVAAAAAAGLALVGILGGPDGGVGDSYSQASEPAPHVLTVDLPSNPGTLNVEGEALTTENITSSGEDEQKVSARQATEGTEEVQPGVEKSETVETVAQEGEGLSQMIKRIDGSFDAENPSDWKKIEAMLDLNRGKLEDSNQDIYARLDKARENGAVSGDTIKALLREGGEKYPVLVQLGQMLQTPR